VHAVLTSAALLIHYKDTQQYFVSDEGYVVVHHVN